jgi:hypothetical protein
VVLQLALAEPDKPGVGLSAAQSCAAQGFADEPAELPQVVELVLGRSATELVLAAQNSLAEPACALPVELLAKLMLKMAVP